MATDTNITTPSRRSLIAAGMVSALGIGATGARAAPQGHVTSPELIAAIARHRRTWRAYERSLKELAAAESRFFRDWERVAPGVEVGLGHMLKKEQDIREWTLAGRLSFADAVRLADDLARQTKAAEALPSASALQEVEARYEQAGDAEFAAREAVARAACATDADQWRKLSYLAGYERLIGKEPDMNDFFGSILVAVWETLRAKGILPATGPVDRLAEQAAAAA